MVGSNRILYDEDVLPDLVVVIKYVPKAGDSKPNSGPNPSPDPNPNPNPNPNPTTHPNPNQVGDSKRAMDEYTADIFMGGVQTIVMHNTCAL